MFMKRIIFILLGVVVSFGLHAELKPTGPQTEGAFRKVILDADEEVDGVMHDTVVDPMELAVAKDGRVFYAQRDGTVKMWRPETKKTVVIGKIPVVTGLGERMLR